MAYAESWDVLVPRDNDYYKDGANQIRRFKTAIRERANDIYPVGTVLEWGSHTPPDGWLICDGSAISRATYAILFAVIGIAFGNGDGATTFNLPDTRGRFIRGHADGQATDPDRGTRVAIAGGNTGDNIGSYQTNNNRSHKHEVYCDGLAGAITCFQLSFAITAAWVENTTTDGGNENRPKNVYVNHIIKYGRDEF